MSAVPSFTEITTVTPHVERPGWFAGHLPPEWNTPVGVHGGMLVAIAARAGRESLGRDDLNIRAIHALFLAPPTYDLAFDCNVIRQGKGSAHVHVRAIDSDGTDALDLTMVLTSGRPSPSFLDARPPEVPGPDEIAAMRPSPESEPRMFPAPPLFDHLEIRTALGELPWSDRWTPDQPGHHVRWSRWNQSPRLADGSYDSLALLPLADLPGPSIWQKFGPDEPVMFFMSLDLSLNLLEPVQDDWILTDIESRRMGEGHVYVETDLWSAGRLAATSAQTMMVRMPKPEA
jgi:acyl-CoA thioesterase